MAKCPLLRNSRLWLNLEGEGYTLKITDVDYFLKKISFTIKNEEYYLLLSEEKKIDRRGYMKYAAAGIVVVAGGAAAAGGQHRPPDQRDHEEGRPADYSRFKRGNKE
jgi:hypothetical protein